MGFSLANPYLGQSKVSWLLKPEGNVDIHASGVPQYLAEGKHEYDCITVSKAC